MCVLCGALWTEQHWAEVAAVERSEAPMARLRSRSTSTGAASACATGSPRPTDQRRFRRLGCTTRIGREVATSYAMPRGTPRSPRTWPPSCPRPSRFSALDPLAPAFLDRVRARTRRSEPVVPDSN